MKVISGYPEEPRMAEHEHVASDVPHHDSAAGVQDIPNPALELTPKAVEMVKRTRTKEGLGDAYGLRVSVVGGGCSGFQYSMNFDAERSESDTVVQFDGVQVLIDEVSLPYIAGTTLDFVEGLHGAGFKFINPKAARTCGCGSSFSV
jgi:iron-sulfur cluster assembly accessory protein